LTESWVKTTQSVLGKGLGQELVDLGDKMPIYKILVFVGKFSPHEE